MQEPTVFTVKMTSDGVNAVLAALGKLPTESGVFPLFADIRDQVMAQAKEAEAAKQPSA